MLHRLSVLILWGHSTDVTRRSLAPAEACKNVFVAFFKLFICGEMT